MTCRSPATLPGLLLAAVFPFAVQAAESPPAAVPAPRAPVVLPREVLFEPLRADPRWPHFSAALHHWDGSQGVETAGTVSLGDGFSFYQQPGLGGAWGVGLQAAVFAVFDLETDSKDLVNADYFVALPFSWKSGDWSAIARLFHVSSHLGDEYLLRGDVNPRDRVNLSYEAVDVKLSRHFWNRALRLYGGVGMLFNQEPEDLEPAMTQWGAEYRAPWTFADGRLRPIAAIDFQSLEATGWNVDVSARAGIELLSDRHPDRALQFSLEYYQGRNPNGQFFAEQTEFWGLGVHAFF